MALRGCISIDRLALQILLRENPEWHGAPVAVTKEERPQSLLLAVNKEAREKGLGPGMRYANALSLVPSLRARAVPQERIARARDRVTRLLSSFTPDVEPCPFDADAFWVSVDGLHSLFPSESAWAEAVRGALAAEGFAACAVIGFTRFGTYIVARRPAAFACVCFPCGRAGADLPVIHRYSPTLTESQKRAAQARGSHGKAVRGTAGSGNCSAVRH